MTCLWRFGVDSGGVEPCATTKPFGVGDVHLCLLLRHDLPVDDLVCCWLSQEQFWMGCCCVCLCGHTPLLYPRHSLCHPMEILLRSEGQTCKKYRSSSQSPSMFTLACTYTETLISTMHSHMGGHKNQH
ncbi:hypothetical protein XENORESO_000563 [Xenotaenia resolanae]|uniref:Uncharacterized protein n=1 Tax=Xenotaenia resolanae TaxID=208358 RepID=A0ABV0W1R8_9TELE